MKEFESLSGGEGFSNAGRVLRHVIFGHPAFVFERKLLGYTTLALLASLAISFLFVGFLNARPFLPLMVLGSVAIALGIGAMFHFLAFGRQNCSTGMMAGMGTGMILGFLVGALFGASSGMFIGSVIGISAGIGLGILAGKCCGNMGVLEGMMAGLMAGTMGAMLSVMLYNDHQFEFLVILWVVSAFILAGLSYMLVKENGPVPANKKLSPWTLLAFSIIFSLVVDVLVVWGPKYGVVWRF
ncbi:MAG: hypothetical protein V1847_03860 [Candidatus Diapherotrites archaeon]